MAHASPQPGPSSTTTGSVHGYELARGTWRRLPDLPPRHGLAGVGIRGKMYAIGGGPTADLGFSSANEYLVLVLDPTRSRSRSPHR